MSYARQLLDACPGTLTADAGVLAATIEALSDCAQACIADADDDLREQNLAEMVTCIRLCWDCADVCTATLGVVTRQAASDASVTRPLLEACVAVCSPTHRCQACRNDTGDCTAPQRLLCGGRSHPGGPPAGSVLPAGLYIDNSTRRQVSDGT